MVEYLLIIPALIVVFLFYVISRPDTFRVQRSLSFKAAPETIFPRINNLQTMSTWSPFEKDAAAKRTFSEPAEGRGAFYEWSGNREMGSGRLEITDSRSPNYVAMQLEMFRPFKADNKVEFTFAPQPGNTTLVTWSMQGSQSYLAKLISTFVNYDKMVGREFDKGLAALKAQAESAA